MTLKGLVVAGALLAVCWTAAAAPLQLGIAPPRDPRLSEFEQWLATILHHSPGLIDDGTIVVGKRSNSDLDALYGYATAVVQLIRNPNLTSKSENLSVSYSVTREDRDQPPRVVRLLFTPLELQRLKQMACALGGFIDAAPCEWVRPAIASDPVLSALSSAATAVRGDTNANFIVRRGALMHTDVAIMGLAAPAASGSTQRPGAVRMTFADGQQTALTEANLHWEFARKLLDLVAGPGTIRPAPSGDAMVRRWYVATTAWMELDGHYENTHLAHGREIFPDDPDLAMLTGAQHEVYATAAVQTAVRSAFLPTGVRLNVESERVELREAERFLRRATELKPDFAEAQIRLGRVLAIMGRDAEAAEHLQRGLAATDDHLLLYYGSLFLATVEEHLGHSDVAKALYLQAAALFPLAQSPLLGLSELARRAGHRDEALSEMEKVYSLRSNERADADPWWTYNRAQGRDADTLLETIQKPLRMSAPR
jgi:tetratricopeptide (TPR) repeat protein